MSFRVKFFTQDVSFRASMTDTQSQGEAAVSSVNGRTGAVVLTSADVAIHSAETNDSLANADEFLYYDNNLHGNRKIDWHHIKNLLVEFFDGIYLREHQSLTEYAKQSWVEAKHYLTEHQSLTDYATKVWVEAKGYITSLAGYATEAWVEAKGYLTQHQSLAEYAKKTELPTVPTNVSAFTNDAGYLTSHQDISGKQDVISDLATIRAGAALGATALQEHQSLVGYATKAYVDALVGDVEDALEALR